MFFGADEESRPRRQAFVPDGRERTPRRTPEPPWIAPVREGEVHPGNAAPTVNEHGEEPLALARAEDFPASLTIEETRPRRFSASMEGFSGPSYSVRMYADGSLLEYLYNPRGFTMRPEAQRTVVKVTPQQWAAFRRNLETAQFWSWEKEYTDNDVPDGTTWRTEVAWADRSGASWGRNSYPDARQFSIFRTAVQELIGGREFR